VFIISVQFFGDGGPPHWSRHSLLQLSAFTYLNLTIVFLKTGKVKLVELVLP
jgi:hypothetical protein